MKALERQIHPEIRIVDAKKGIVDYVASDETIDSYAEVIKASGWRFDLFKKNSPLVNSHNYSGIENSLGKVTDFSVKDGQLINRAQFAIDVPENKMAALAFGMVAGGYLPAVSVGFFPTAQLSRHSLGEKDWTAACEGVGCGDKAASVRTIYTEQQQCELSVCILGANPNALLKARTDGVIKDADFRTLGFQTDEDMEALTDVADAFDSFSAEGQMLSLVFLRAIAGRKRTPISKNSSQHNAISAIAPDGADLARRREHRAAFLGEMRSFSKR